MRKCSALLFAGYSANKKAWNRRYKWKLILSLILLIPLCLPAQIKVYNPGQAFTCITVDAESRIWAGTNKAGLYTFDEAQKKTGTAFLKRSFGNLDGYNIQTLAADFHSSLWIGHNGLANTGASGGGIDEIDIRTLSLVKHYLTDRNAECFSFFERDGLATSNSASIAIDRAGTVWSAHRYHDLFVTGSPGSPAQYILTPGSLSFKFRSSPRFYSLSTYQDYRTHNESPELPYPAYTCNPSPSQTPYARNCYAVAAGNDGVWLSVGPYLPKDGPFLQARILKYGLDGFYTNQSFDLASMGVPGGGIFNGIWVTPTGNVWVTTTTGRVMMYNGVNWLQIVFPGTFPSSITPNYNAITGDDNGKVYLGTNQGLIVYNGKSVFSNSSYKIYTAADGLLSANVKGVAVENSGAVWMATENGIAKIQAYPFTVYNLRHPVRGDEMNADKFAVVSATDEGLQPNGDPVEINVAADSSQATLIVYAGNDLKSKKLVITGATVANAYYTSEYGELKELVRKDDSLVYLYHHPAYVYRGEEKKFESYSFRLKDTITNQSLVDGKLNIYHAPVLLVHGVWSSTGAFDNMRNYLVKASGNYEDFQLWQAWEPTSNHNEYIDGAYRYRQKIPQGIDDLLRQCRINLLSAGKVNLVAHSRGGLYARYYLQSSAADVPYRNDINSLITINTPHSGSQAANLILDKRKIIPGAPDLLQLGNLMSPLFLSNDQRPDGKDDINGAYELRVNDPILLRELNSAPNLNRNIVPSHAITSQYVFGTFSKADLLKTLYINAATRVPYVGNVLLGLRQYVLILGSACTEGPIDNCLREIFREGNDIVVPLSSQSGGLESKAVWYQGNKIAHSQKRVPLLAIDLPATLDAEATHKKVAELLRENIPNETTSHFSKKGFHPVNLAGTYKFLPNLPGNPETGRIAIAQLTIDPLLKGKTFQSGETIMVNVTGSSDIKTLLLACSGNSLAEAASDVEPAASFTFPYPIPKEAFGKISLTAYGFNDNGLVAFDTSYINVGASGVTLDSLRIESDANGQLRVAAKESIQVGIIGYFSDTVRRLTALPGINYSFRANGPAAVTSTGVLSGIVPGKWDQLTVSYLGKADTVRVLVSDSVPTKVLAIPLPVTFLSFTGAYNNGVVQLNWATAQELNNKQFDVQYSVDDFGFVTIGSVPGKGNSNAVSEYRYPTYQYRQGKNYYRLNQVDVDGNHNFSLIVVVIVEEGRRSSISLHPNPTSNKIIVDFHGVIQNKLKLELTDMTGRKTLMINVPGRSTSLTVDLPAMPSGMYLVTITTERGEILLTEKLIIQ